MSLSDLRGCRISGATPAALDEYEHGLAAFQSWRSGAEQLLSLALQEAPGFVMAHVLQVWLLLCSRDPQRVRSARPSLVRAAALPANDRERMHLAAIAGVLDDDHGRARATLDALLRLHPRDVLALQVAHALDYLLGDAERMLSTTAAVLPAWSSGLTGYHAVLAMHAFGLEECGEYSRAEQAAGEALVLNPLDARAHHVMAHVFEMTARVGAGVRWMSETSPRWSTDTVVATHCWWHLALFELERGQVDAALALYDRRIRAAFSPELGDLIDASALLWRVHLHGGDPGTRWRELATAWSLHVDDGFCSFSDMHAMMAFIGARNWGQARRLEATLAARQSWPTRHGATTRQVGLPACRALLAFGSGDYGLAVTLLASLPAVAHRLGGSHAQRGALHLTLRRAVELLQRSPRARSIVAPRPAGLSMASP